MDTRCVNIKDIKHLQERGFVASVNCKRLAVELEPITTCFEGCYLRKVACFGLSQVKRTLFV
jgi:hypothetical protein